MNSKFLVNRNPSSNQLSGKSVAAEWSASLATFYDYYYKVDACIQENKLNEVARKRMMGLRMRMQAELQILLQDMNQSEVLTPAGNQRFKKQLVTHTRCLRQLNYQAFLLLAVPLPN
ncbi:hypothetical protein GO755_26335 [Spirosoma sp. HMF4905]|uniref:Uncharacterized protein n=1 Tax=Spirosoma arboris TaxID=2682092 RepID=A0A7K1SIN6_9BACT|nr:hypothetical protein [Spirosoma arboris]MVM33584.1 hypothetical protein [Spirosoma arboris]